MHLGGVTEESLTGGAPQQRWLGTIGTGGRNSPELSKLLKSCWRHSDTLYSCEEAMFGSAYHTNLKKKVDAKIEAIFILNFHKMLESKNCHLVPRVLE